jgi:hypothetical protein
VTRATATFSATQADAYVGQRFGLTINLDAMIATDHHGALEKTLTG